jgi:hypothetical protein
VESSCELGNELSSSPTGAQLADCKEVLSSMKLINYGDIPKQEIKQRQEGSYTERKEERWEEK